jgi:predicted metal-dependent phosphotriesterase family hydrolase
MAIMNSALGPMDTANLGITLAHEHVISSSPGIPQEYPELLDQGYKELVLQGLREAKAGGISLKADSQSPFRIYYE